MFGPRLIDKLTFRLNFDLVSRSNYLLQARDCPLIQFSYRIVIYGDDVAERVIRMAVPVAPKQPVYCLVVGALNVYTKVGQIGYFIHATVPTVHYLHPMNLLHVQ